MNIEVRQPVARSEDALRHCRLRHPSQSCARGHAALPVEPVVGPPADLRAAPAPRLRQSLSDAEDHAAGGAPRCVAAERRAAGKRSRISCSEQLLDLYDMDYGIMNPLSPTGQGDQNAEFSAAMAFAANEVQLEALGTAREAAEGVGRRAVRGSRSIGRRRSSRRAGDKDFAQVFMLSRTIEAHGRRRYWPIYEAAVEAGLPVGIHVFGYAGWAMTNSGWPSFYIEEMTEHATGQAGRGRQHDLRGRVRAVSATSRSC